MLNNVSCIETNNGEFIGTAILEVTSVPHVDILRDGHTTTADIENEVRLSFGNLLSEIYQSYTRRSRKAIRYAFDFWPICRLEKKKKRKKIIRLNDRICPSESVEW